MEIDEGTVAIFINLIEKHICAFIIGDVAKFIGWAKATQVFRLTNGQEVGPEP